MWHHFSSSIAWLYRWRYTNSKKVAIRALEAHSDSGRTSTMYLHGHIEWWGRYGCPEQQISRQHMWIMSIFVLFSHLFPMWGQQTDRPGHSLLRCHAFLPFFNKRHETRSLATDFPLFNLDAGSMPTLLDSTVSLPFLIQPKHGLVCMK